MKITVSQGTNIAGRFPDCIEDTRILTKDVILPCKSQTRYLSPTGGWSDRGNIENWQLVSENKATRDRRSCWEMLSLKMDCEGSQTRDINHGRVQQRTSEETEVFKPF